MNKGFDGMILGLGNDLTSCVRIQKAMDRFGSRFLDRVFTSQEQAYGERRRGAGMAYIGTYAKRFAAKEAAAKALGTGFTQGIGWRDIEVVSGENGAPTVCFHGAALVRLQSMVPQGWVPKCHVALTDDEGLAMAHVIVSAIPQSAEPPDF